MNLEERKEQWEPIMPFSPIPLSALELSLGYDNLTHSRNKHYIFLAFPVWKLDDFCPGPKDKGQQLVIKNFL